MSSSTITYRAVIREINRSSVSAPGTRNKVIASSFRALFDKKRNTEEQARFDHDMKNTFIFLHSQRMHKELLERYNPLHDLTPEERIKATARRVGLDVPVNSEKDS
ncbi:hypothetical protein BDY19DRAFT_903575 [Irpex rosettiformis]|uniref:Uncharacterized protein n=1 Tax=Irpex rosettiformis TaxID=378272 RepID=A0ACB8UF86_9APHY|nr:hypothetical protein BDY19DRAFT_903575 [Irpex rosettiformis]